MHELVVPEMHTKNCSQTEEEMQRIYVSFSFLFFLARSSMKMETMKCAQIARSTVQSARSRVLSLSIWYSGHTLFRFSRFACDAFFCSVLFLFLRSQCVCLSRAFLLLFFFLNLLLSKCVCVSVCVCVCMKQRQKDSLFFLIFFFFL